jgi:hypothetical protein
MKEFKLADDDLIVLDSEGIRRITPPKKVRWKNYAYEYTRIALIGGF